MKNFAALLAAMSLISIFVAQSASATLEENEKKSLKRVLKVYKQAMGIEKLYKILGPDLGRGRKQFLAEKIKGLGNHRLPDLEVRGDSRIVLKVGSAHTVIDFISLRSETLAINGREVEFLPDESNEQQWAKLQAAINRKSASYSLIFGDQANAADDPTSASATSALISSSVFAITSAASATFDCDRAMDDLRRSCDSTGETAQLARMPKTTLRGDEAKPAMTCTSAKAPTDAEYTALQSKLRERLEKAGRLKDEGDIAAFKSDNLTGDQLHAIQDADKSGAILSTLARYKSNQLTQKTVEILKNPGTGGDVCKRKAVDCVKGLYSQIASENQDTELACFVTQSRKSIEAAEGGRSRAGAGSNSSRSQK